jgi:NAD+ diphosphatase
VSTGRFSAGFAFVEAGVDRAGDLREDPEAIAAHWCADDTELVFLRRDGRVLLDASQQLYTAVPAKLPHIAPGHASFLGLRGSIARFSLVIDDVAVAGSADPDSLRFADLRGALGVLDAADAGLAAYARALAHWQSRKRWCGVCGAPTRLTHAGHRAECSNPDCAASYFPRTDPAIIVIVSSGRQCLLGRQPSWPPNRYSTLAGFVEPGETLEQAVAREVAEESGVRIERCSYLGSQPWPFPASLMLGFEAQATLQPPVVGSELADARWFDADAMPQLIASGELALSPAMSIAFHLIDHWYRGLTGESLTPGHPLVLR